MIVSAEIGQPTTFYASPRPCMSEENRPNLGIVHYRVILYTPLAPHVDEFKPVMWGYAFLEQASSPLAKGANSKQPKT